MKLMSFTTPAEVTAAVAEEFIAAAARNPHQPLGLATGATMLGVYQNLHHTGWSPECAHVFALDEYLGLEPDHPNSFHAYLIENFVTPLGFQGALHVPGVGPYKRNRGHLLFEKNIAAYGPLAIQLLGLGTNGHVAFNEPGTPRDSRTRDVSLSEATIVANQGYFDPPSTMPTRASTQGIATIKQATELVVVVLGEHKRVALIEALDPHKPAPPFAGLRDHPHVTIFTDLAM